MRTPLSLPVAWIAGLSQRLQRIVAIKQSGQLYENQPLLLITTSVCIPFRYNVMTANLTLFLFV